MSIQDCTYSSTVENNRMYMIIHDGPTGNVLAKIEVERRQRGDSFENAITREGTEALRGFVLARHSKDTPEFQQAFDLQRLRVIANAGDAFGFPS